MKSFIILAALVVYVVADGFDDWKKKNGRSYTSSDAESAAAARYKNTAADVARHNADPSKSYKTEANQAAANTAEENAQRNGLKYDPNEQASKVHPKTKGDPPVSVNYTDSMQPIKDQGQCGSCWAVSIASVYEYYNLKKNSKKGLISEQNFVDCDANSLGCNGGSPINAMIYAKANGISNGTEYKYVAKKQTCQRTSSKNLPTYKTSTGACAAQLNGDEATMKQILATYGPVVVAISVGTCSRMGSSTTFNFYKSGIYNDQVCSTNMKYMDHAVVIVGYGVDSANVPFWILRNSWGTQWGEYGYMRVLRGKNIAGIANILYIPCEAT